MLGVWASLPADRRGTLTAITSAVTPRFNGTALMAEYGDAELVAELAQLFLETATSQMDAIRGAVERLDAAALKAAAHRLRGAVATFGAVSATELSFALESKAATGDLSTVQDLAATLDAEMKALCADAGSWLAEHAA